MQRVTNCLIINGDEVLLLKKPRYGWYAMPGGKMEPGESIYESVLREVKEETGLMIDTPQLYSVATMTKASAQSPKDEWMMFTFKTEQFSGDLVTETPEGELEWIPLVKLDQIPTAPSDRLIHQYILQHDKHLYGSFDLDEQDQLISYRLNDN
ncbi:8-oxo-dGTP diphosphatase [Amphibacillus sp. MSJ-3]|uniref:8-oxo-dGTP diphosphatase n=1 Tax=Amphibacillus sp. MSJ-3 TaxID=2841505 RepID=UPI001C0F19F9|nr:8-oxo-dGTP diphosphatase [Amphibacillus sp. MSJ-3]MBU5593988.1 8-oxo-dGTP diphosphatase [Amphibacillus sp. MSJ-3]